MNRPDDWGDHLDPSSARSPAPGDELSPQELAALDRIRTSLADEAVWGEPPEHLRSALLTRVAAEARTGPEVSPLSAVPPQSALPRQGTSVHRSRRSARSRRPWYLAVTGAAAATVLAVVLAWPRPEVTTFAMAGTSASGVASATAELEVRSAGVAITLEIKGLKAAPAGAYYSAWMRGPGGTIPVGTFHWRKGGIPIELWSGVSPSSYPELFVTLQREGEPATPSSDVVLSGRVSG